MKRASYFAAPAAMILLLLCEFARADNPTRHPAYLRAQAKLRDARAQLSVAPQQTKQELPPNAGDLAHGAETSPASDEQRAIEEIERALQDVRDASEDDGKGFDDHAPVDANLDRRERLLLALDTLDQASAEIEQRQQDSYWKGLKANDAQEHIGKAKKAILRSMGAARNWYNEHRANHSGSRTGLLQQTGAGLK